MLIIAIEIYLMNIFDLIATSVLVKKFGMEAEANPIGKLILADKALSIAVKGLFMLAVLFFLYVYSYFYTAATVVLWILFGIYCLLTVYHIVLMFIVKKNDL